MALSRNIRLQSYLAMYFAQYHDEDESFVISSEKCWVIPQVIALFDEVNDITKKLLQPGGASSGTRCAV